MIFVVVGLASLSACLLVTLVALIRAHDRTYQYAVTQSERLPVDDPAGMAYSDMATVIVLDGRAELKKWPQALRRPRR